MAVTSTIPARETLPAAGTWRIDPAHTTAEFVAKHLVVAKVRGRFAKVSGQADIREDLSTSTVQVEIDASSIDTHEPDRDAHLRSADFLDVDQYPTLEFRSTDVRHVESDRWAVDGDLSIRGVTRPVTLDVEFQGLATDPWGNQRGVVSATTDIDREDFGLTWNQKLETGGVLVGKRVRIDLEVQLVQQ